MPKKRVEKKIFSLDDLKPKKHYRIKVKSFNKDKKLIGESPWVIFKTTGKNQAPPNVTNLEADFRGRQLVVTWDAPWKESTTDFKDFVIKVESPGSSQEKIFAVVDEKFTFSADQNRNLFGSFRGTIKVTVYSRDRTNNQSGGVSITAYAEIPEDPTNVRLTAATLGYNVSWDLPLFENYDYTRIYESSSQNGTFSIVKTERGSSTYVPRNNFNEVWVKVSHVNLAGAESNLVASVPPSIIPIDPVPVDVNPPNVPTNLNWEDPEVNALNSSDGITTAAKRAHWEVSDIASGYKVRVSENQQNWAVYDVPASRASVTFKESSGTTATLTVTSHSFSQYDYITVFNVGSPFDGKFKITSTTETTISYTLPSASTISQTAATGTAVISSYTVKELTPGTTYYGSILAYDGANNLTQFVSDGQFSTSGTAGQIGSAITIAGTSMKFGPSAGGAGNNGLFINSSNYWYSTGTFNVGTSGNSVSWDGVRLRLDGAILARSGSFSGNVFISGSGTNSGSLIASNPYNIQTASWSAGIGTIITATTPSPTWQTGDVVVISQTSSSFDGQYTLLSASGNTFTFSMTNSAQTTINTGLVVNVTRGNRTVFNSQGIESFKDNNVIFSLNNDSISKIAGWTITNDRIFSGSTTNYVAVSSSESSGWRIWAGSATPSTAPFRVNSSGQIRGYGLFSSRDTDSGTRVSVGSNIVAGRDGILIDDTSSTGYENFWYVPSQVGTGVFFRVGSSTASGITVSRRADGTPRVKIKDYDIEGVTSIIDDSKITVNTVEIGKGVGGAGKHGIKIDGSNYWYDPGPLNSTDVVFRAGGSDNRSLTVLKNGSVSFEGETNPTGGTIKGKLTIQGTTYAFGKDVMTLRDGIYLNANNYWTLSQSGATANFSIGGANNYILWDGSSLNIQIGGSNVAKQSDLTLKADATGTAILSLIQNSATGGITGVSLTSSGQIYSAGKTSFDSSVSGWYLGYDSGTPRFGIGDSNNYMRWNGSSLSIQGNITGSTFTGGTFRTGTTQENRVEMISGSSADRIQFPLIRTTDNQVLSETQSAYIRIIPTTDNDGDFARILELRSPIVTGFNPSSAIKLMTGRGTTAGNSSRLIFETPWVVFSGSSGFTSGSQTIQLPAIPDYSTTTTTASYVLGSAFGYQLAWFDAADFAGGGGASYTSADVNGIIVNNTTDTIDNAGFRKVGTTTSWTATRTNQKNRITYGATLPGEGSGRSDGDIHIEF